MYQLENDYFLQELIHNVYKKSYDEMKMSQMKKVVKVKSIIKIEPSPLRERSKTLEKNVSTY